MEFRSKILTLLNKPFPIPIHGDVAISEEVIYDISCVINFYGRIKFLRNILSCLKEQNINKSRFEVLLVEDRNGTSEGSEMAKEFSDCLNITYLTLKNNFGIMGYSRNVGILSSKGKYILLLDDDTVILQSNFLTLLLETFERKKPDGVIPMGRPSFCLSKSKYQFHDLFFPANKCIAYSRETLIELKGFNSKIIGQEDVEFTIRLSIRNKKLLKNPELVYYHPPLIQQSYNKSAAVGFSYYRLKNKYPFVIWILLLMNGCRYLPLGALQFNDKHKNQFRFSMGFLIGIFYGIINKKVDYR